LLGGVSVIKDDRIPPYLSQIIQDKSHLSALRTRLAGTNDLRELIANPPVILLDTEQQLFFYRGIQIKLQPSCFQCLLILARNPRQIVARDKIYHCLWPGDMNYTGDNKPYESQISDQKRRGVARLKKGLEGKIMLAPGELESLIITMPKVRYVLNLEKEDVVILP